MLPSDPSGLNGGLLLAASTQKVHEFAREHSFHFTNRFLDLWA